MGKKYILIAMRKSMRVDIICLQFDNLFYLQCGDIYCLHCECIVE